MSRVNEEEYPNLSNSLDMGAFKKLIQDLVTVKFDGRFSFTGFCEPLLTKNLNEYVNEIKKNLPDSRVEIVSNGDVLLTKVGSKTLDNLFLAGLDVIESVCMMDLTKFKNF